MANRSERLFEEKKAWFCSDCYRWANESESASGMCFECGRLLILKVDTRPTNWLERLPKKSGEELPFHG